MSIGESLLTLVVAFIVFGPKKLPMLIQHTSLLLRQMNHYKQQARLMWNTLLCELQRKEKENKAKEIIAYKEKDTGPLDADNENSG